MACEICLSYSTSWAQVAAVQPAESIQQVDAFGSSVQVIMGVFMHETFKALAVSLALALGSAVTDCAVEGYGVQQHPGHRCSSLPAFLPHFSPFVRPSVCKSLSLSLSRSFSVSLLHLSLSLSPIPRGLATCRWVGGLCTFQKVAATDDAIMVSEKEPPVHCRPESFICHTHSWQMLPIWGEQVGSHGGDHATLESYV